MRKSVTRFTFLAFLVLLVSGIADRVAACTAAPPPPPFWIVKDGTHGPKQVWIVIHNYETFGSAPGQFCACGVTNFPAIGSVDSVAIVLAGTDTVLGNFSFSANATTSAALSSASGVSMTGFLSGVGGAIPAGINVDLHFEVTLAANSSVNDLRDQVSAGGIAVGTDEADAGGGLTGLHQALLPASSVGVAATQVSPTLTEWAMIAISAAMLIGIVRARRAYAHRSVSPA